MEKRLTLTSVYRLNATHRSIQKLLDFRTHADQSNHQLMLKNRQTPVCEGQNWGPEDFGDERNFMLACAKIMQSKGLHISLPRVSQLLLLERLNGTEPIEAIEKHSEAIFFRKKYICF